MFVKYKADLIIISLKINLFSPWYSWNICELALNNNHLILGISVFQIRHLLTKLFFLIPFIYIDTYWKRSIGDLQNIDIVYIFIRIDVVFCLSYPLYWALGFRASHSRYQRSKYKLKSTIINMWVRNKIKNGENKQKTKLWRLRIFYKHWYH